jgi:hypothetical protein
VNCWIALSVFTVKEFCSVRPKSPDEQAVHKIITEGIFTDETSLPVTAKKQRAVVYLLHRGLHRSLESLDFLEGLCLPHEVESVEDGFPECPYFVIPILLLFQSLQNNHVNAHSRCYSISRDSTNLLRSRQDRPCKFRVWVNLPLIRRLNEE